MSFRDRFNLRRLSTLTTREVALVLFVVSTIIYQFPLIYDLGYKPFFNWAPGQDIASTSLLPLVILERGDFTLNEFQGFFADNYDNTYFVADVNGKLVSRSPVAAAVVALPFYGVPLGTGWIANPHKSWLNYPWTAFFVAKFTAAFLCALAALMFFFCARELTDLKTSAALTLVFAFGTSVWSTASQGLWQQTPSVFFQLIGIWFILRGRRLGASAVAPGAFFFSVATIARPNDGLTALLFTLFVFLEYRSAIFRWIAWALPPAIFFLAYNAIYNGSPFVFGYQDGILQYTVAPRLDAILGLFISPSRGLFVYSPFFIFAFAGVWLARREDARRFYAFVAAAFVLCVFVLSIWEYWDGGWGYGTRMLTDVLPYAALLLIPVVKQLRGAQRWVFWGMVVFAMLLHSFALWDYGVRWHWHWNNYAYDDWNVAENEPLFYLRQYVDMAQHFINVYLHR